MNSIDNKQVVCLVLLDLTAAFNTVDHSIFPQRLEHRYSINGTALEWFMSYLQNRMQCVTIGDLKTDSMTSDEVLLTFGVLQGSGLGPPPFILYLGSLGDLYQSHGINVQMYADEQQIYMSFKPSRTLRKSQQECVSLKEDCIADIRRWMNTNL